MFPIITTIKIPFLLMLAFVALMLFTFWRDKMPLAVFRWLATPALGLTVWFWFYEQQQRANWALYASLCLLAINVLLARFVEFIKNDYK